MSARCLLLALVPISAAALSVSGCGGRTNASVIQEYAPKVAPIREKLARIAKLVETEPQFQNPPEGTPPSPPPVFTSDPAASNTAILNLEQAKDPDAAIPPDRIDFGLHRDSDLRDALIYTGPKCPWNDTAKNQRGDSFARQCERALQTKYVVIVRTVHYQKPVATAEDQYDGGNGNFEGFLVDLSSEKIVARAYTLADSGANVNFEVITGGGRNDDPQERMVASVHSAVSHDARKKLGEKLGKVSGGNLDFSAR